MSRSATPPRFCSQCGAGLRPCADQVDGRQRMVCPDCKFVAYENPKVLVACLATWGGSVLMMRRGTEPRRGFWAIPAGFMECGESPEQAAARELNEETRSRVDPDSLNLFLVGSLPDISEVYLVYRGELLSPHCEVTDEASEVGLFTRNECPGAEFAYPDIVEFLDRFLVEHEQGIYNTYSARYTGGKHEIRKISRGQLDVR